MRVFLRIAANLLGHVLAYGTVGGIMTAVLGATLGVFCGFGMGLMQRGWGDALQGIAAGAFLLSILGFFSGSLCFGVLALWSRGSSDWHTFDRAFPASAVGLSLGVVNALVLYGAALWLRRNGYHRFLPLDDGMMTFPILMFLGQCIGMFVGLARRKS